MKVYLRCFNKNLMGGEDTTQDGGMGWRGRRWRQEPQVLLFFLPTFLFLCSDFLIFNCQVTVLFRCRNPSHYLFLSKRGKLSVLKQLFSIWLGERYFPSARWLFYFHLNFHWYGTLLNAWGIWKPIPWHSTLWLLARNLTLGVIFKNILFRQNVKYTFLLESKSVDRPFKDGMSQSDQIWYLLNDVLNELICYQRNNLVILKEIKLPVFPSHVRSLRNHDFWQCGSSLTPPVAVSLLLLSSLTLCGLVLLLYLIQLEIFSFI